MIIQWLLNHVNKDNNCTPKLAVLLILWYAFCSWNLTTNYDKSGADNE
jgi:hypothetical protein